MPLDQIYFDTPTKFSIDEVIRYINNMNSELINKKKNRIPISKDGEEFSERLPKYFDSIFEFDKLNADYVNGPYTNDFERLILRLENTRNNPRLKFLFNDACNIDIDSVLKQFIGYGSNESNITIIDLSGIPFEVLSITVSLISRLLFEFSYFYKKYLNNNQCETPLLLVYEEAHKYVPKNELAKYKPSKIAIERIAKEGRKYGITLGVISQRPSEISETIFSQCNNFVVMRLTNPEDQNYVKRLLPDGLGNLVDYLPSLEAGEALLTGEAISIPSLVKIEYPDCEPHSADIPYLTVWKGMWASVLFEEIIKKWKS